MGDALDPAMVVVLAPHARLRFDKTREAWLLLGPERVLTPSATAIAILQACDGTRSIATIAHMLAERYGAPQDRVLADTLALLGELAAKGYLRRQRDEAT